MMNRRRFLLAGGACLAAPTMLSASLKQEGPKHFGWIQSDEARRRFISRTNRPFFEDHAYDIAGSGDDREILLSQYYEKATKAKFVPHYQEIGDCVGQASTLGAEFVCATQIAYSKKNEQWKGKFSTEVTYAGSRVEIGGGVIRRGDGSTGAWAAEWLKRYGTVLRGKYGNIDLTKYDPDIARQWGKPRVGVPDELEAIAKEHPVKTVTLVRSWKEACDAIANGYPVLICSSVGFNTRTDKEGFLTANDVWYHALLLIGIDTKSIREGGCIANSWGTNWVSGPKHRLGTPDGCFWADARVIDAMIKQGDSFALSNFVGYPRRDLDYLLY